MVRAVKKRGRACFHHGLGVQQKGSFNWYYDFDETDC